MTSRVVYVCVRYCSVCGRYFNPNQNGRIVRKVIRYLNRRTLNGYDRLNAENTINDGFKQV